MKLTAIIISVFFLFPFLWGCNDSSNSSSTISPGGESYLHERDFAADPELYATPDQVVILQLESPFGSADQTDDTGGVGEDSIPILFPETTGHEFRLEVSGDDQFSMVLTDPSGSTVLFLDSDSPTAAVDLQAGVHTVTISHGGGTNSQRTVFIRPGSTVVSKDCPGCDLSGADLSGHNLSGADLSGADLSGTNLTHGNLSSANLSGANTEGANVTNADMTGSKNSCPDADTCTQEGVNNCYNLAPQSQCDSYGDYTILQLYQSDSSGTMGCPYGDPAKGTDAPTKMYSLEPGYWLVTVENNFYLQPFQCLIQTTANGWEVDEQCTTNPNQPMCQGCQYLATNQEDTFNLATLCVEQNNGVSSYPRVYLLDQRNGNLLYRGSKPCVQSTSGSWSFDYDNLMQVLRDRYATQVGGSGFPTTFKFVDISLIDDVSTAGILMAEYNFFGGTASAPSPTDTQPAGDTFKSLSSPSGTTATVSGQFRWRNRPPCVNGTDDNTGLGALVEEIGTLMDATDGSYVVYFHCDAGSDRTGETAISYLLNHLNMSPEDAYVYGTTIFSAQAGGALARTRQDPPPILDYLQCAIDYCSASPSTCAASDCDYTTMDNSDAPGGTKYPQPYPWSQTSWTGGCFD